MVVEDEPGALGEVEVVGEREHEELRSDRHLGERAEHAEGGHAVPGREPGPVGRRTHHAADLAAGDERQLGLDLVLAAGLKDLRERHARGMHVDDYSGARGEHVRGLGLGHVGELQGRVGTA